MRVLHLINAFQPGGIETWLLRMLGTISRDDIAMDFCCKGRDTGLRAPDAEELGAAVIHCPLTITHQAFVGGTLRLLQSGYYDVVHNHLDVTGGPAVWAAKKANVPVISSFHNTHFAPQTWTRFFGIRQLRELYAKFSIDYALKNSKFITGCSQAVLARVAPDHATDPRCRTLYYGVETHEPATEQERTKFRKSLGLAPSAKIVLHVGRYSNQKNHPGLLRVFAETRKSLPEAHLVLVGDGELRSSVEYKIRELGLTPAVSMLGFRDDVAKIMTSSDAFLFPSFHEGLPVVSLEASACHLPLIGSNIDGTNEAIVHGKTGLLHELDDETGMAESLLRVLTNESFAQDLRSAAVKRIEDHFSVAASSQSLMKLYEDAIYGEKSVSIRRAA